jgi:hypothetical protein
MPALLTHDYFGQDVIAYIGGTFFNRDNETLSTELRNAFLLGNQGPDPLFFTLFSPAIRISKEFGSLMHREKVDETIEAFREYASKRPEPQKSLVYAYLLGFICHFTLDSTMHPFVYAQQNALCDAGVEGLDRSDASVVHGQIEADFDSMLLCQREGVDVSIHDYTDKVLKASDGTLSVLDAAYQAVALEVYDVELPAGLFARGVKDYRATVRFLYSPQGTKRALLGSVERIFRNHSLLQAITLRAGVGETCDFDNHEREVWINPFTDESDVTSFADLYHKAVAAAVDNAALLVHGGAASDLTKGLNFEGAPCQS